ncbi:hypothetical protein CQ056_26825 [Peribacillus simplex]|nr:hypothetical protein CQ056_26825 [Peribacillus simplex]
MQLFTLEIYLVKVFEKGRHAIHLWSEEYGGIYIRRSLYSKGFLLILDFIEWRALKRSSF